MLCARATHLWTLAVGVIMVTWSAPLVRAADADELRWYLNDDPNYRLPADDPDVTRMLEVAQAVAGEDSGADLAGIQDKYRGLLDTYGQFFPPESRENRSLIAEIGNAKVTSDFMNSLTDRRSLESRCLDLATTSLRGAIPWVARR